MLFLRLWSDLFGHSLFPLRGFSVFFGIATIWAGYDFIKIVLQKESLALATALLLAVNPFQIQYVTEARMYTLGTFLLLISGYFLVKKHLIRKNSFTGLALSSQPAQPCIPTITYSSLSFAIGLFALYYLFKTPL